jgi:proline iminopeptidase
VDSAYGAIVKQIPAFLFFSPAYRLRDVASFMGGQGFCLAELYPHWMAFKSRDLGATFALPVFIIQGANDVMTPTHLVAAWLDEISAPQKQLIAIPGGGHLVFATAADAYLEALVTLVRPLARRPT